MLIFLNLKLQNLQYHLQNKKNKKSLNFVALLEPYWILKLKHDLGGGGASFGHQKKRLPGIRDNTRMAFREFLVN